MIYLYCTIISIVVSLVTSLFVEAYQQRRASEEIGENDKYRH